MPESAPEKLKPESTQKIDRRTFLHRIFRFLFGALALALVGKLGLSRGQGTRRYWQVDPYLCTQCGRCETHCVRAPSAVKCVHGYGICGYCDLCSGYLRSGAALDTGAEGNLCPTSAITRSFVEDPYFEYVIEEKLCIGCGKCVKGCSDFGNGSLFLQIKQDLCLHCNQCSIASVCPAGAVVEVSPEDPYKIKGGV